MIRISYAVWYLQRFNIDYWFCYFEEGWAVYHNLSSSSFPPKNVLRFCFIWFHIRNTYCSPSMIIHLSHILSLSFCLSHSLFPSLSLSIYLSPSVAHSLYLYLSRSLPRLSLFLSLSIKLSLSIHLSLFHSPSLSLFFSRSPNNNDWCDGPPSYCWLAEEPFRTLSIQRNASWACQ